MAFGITSACAEQTAAARGASATRRDHLRVCGADRTRRRCRQRVRGSPPRVRSRPGDEPGINHRTGITSACAEQTADARMTHRPQLGGGSPPRVRSRRWSCRRPWLRGRITSACAEQTKSSSGSCLGKYGSPPRVRSRQSGHSGLDARRGITSACAEQTTCYADKHTNVRDHLRVCGADSPACDTIHDLRGSHPRSPGIISACAEQTSRSSFPLRACRDHLRVCGADPDSFGSLRTIMGSPPRVRSRLKGIDIGHILLRITSACAEQTEE